MLGCGKYTCERFWDSYYPWLFLVSKMYYKSCVFGISFFCFPPYSKIRSSFQILLVVTDINSGYPGWIRVCYSNLPPEQCKIAAKRLSMGIQKMVAENCESWDIGELFYVLDIVCSYKKSRINVWMEFKPYTNIFSGGTWFRVYHQERMQCNPKRSKMNLE